MSMYTTIDLCAGIGGIRRGFELVGGFTNLMSAEVDKFACQTYEHLFGENPFNDVTADSFLDELIEVNKRQKINVLLAGFPCQTFSRVGTRAGFEDKTKGTIFFSIAKILKEIRPEAFLLENVEFLTTHDKGKTFHTILEILVTQLHYKVIGVTESNGDISYDAKNFVRNSKDFGLPQNRPRTYIVGFDREHFGQALEYLPQELPKRRDRPPIFSDLNELIEHGVDADYYMAQGAFNTLKKHRERQNKKGYGFGYKIVNASDIEHPIASTLLATGGSGKERNLLYDPQDGIAGMILPTRKTPLNDEGIRVMTPTEWGRLQGFCDYAFVDENGKDRFSFPEGITKTQKYKQLGNSVTIPVIEEMARFIKDQLDILMPSYLIRQKLLNNGGHIVLSGQHGGSYTAELTNNGKRIRFSSGSSKYNLDVFDVIVGYMRCNGNHLRKGTPVNAKLGNPGCDHTTVLGAIGAGYRKKEPGAPVAELVFALCEVMEWAGICENRAHEVVIPKNSRFFNQKSNL